MKASIAAIAFAALAAAIPAPAPGGNIIAKRAPAPPQGGSFFTCDTTPDSPGSSNVRVAAANLRGLGDATCSHDGGDSTTLRHDNGVRVYMHGKAGSIPCTSVADRLEGLVRDCEENSAGDFRTGGVIWANSEAEGTYISVSK